MLVKFSDKTGGKMKKLIKVICVMIIITGISYSQTINISSPKGSDIWYKGKTNDIKWTISGNMNNFVKIRLFTKDGRQKLLAITDKTPNNGSFPWTIPFTFASDEYIVRVKTIDNNVFADSNKFRISEESAPPPASPSRDRFKAKALNVNPIAKSGPTSIRPTPSNAPDLVITSFRQDPPNPQKSEHWRFEVSVKNIGNVNAFFPKGFNTIGHNAKGTLVGKTENRDITIPPGQTQKFVQYSGINKVGTFPVTFKVDPGNIVNESNEMNNKKSGNFTITKPNGGADLVITKITTDIPRTTQGFYVHITVNNKGLGFNPIQGQQLWIKTIKGNPIFSFKGLLNVKPGESRTVKCWVVNPPAGSISWEVKVDPDNLLSEANENNNVKVLHLTVK